MKTFLFLNISGDFESIAMRVKAEGNPIYYYKNPRTQAKGREDTGVGIFDKKEIIDDFWEVLNKESKDNLIIVVDDNGQGDMLEYLRNDGWKIIGGNSFADKIEHERGAGTKLMGKLGLGLPEEHNFNNLNEGISFVESQDDDYRAVFKPEGENFAGSSKTYTGKNRDDLIGFMKWMINDSKEKHYSVEKFLLQEFIDGIECDFAGYFNGEEFLPCVILDIEEKKSGDGNKGEAVGCAGNIILTLEKSRYFDEYLVKLTPLLKKTGYVGEISINNIFAYGNEKYQEGMPYGLEFTSRFGWDAAMNELCIIEESGGSIAEFYEKLVYKQPYKFPYNMFSCGVRVYTGSVSLKKDEVAGRYFSYDKSIENNLWFYSVSKSDEGYRVEDNPLLCVNTANKSLQNCIDECYKKLDKLYVPDIYFRNQIGQRASKVLRFLHKYEWI